MEETVSSEQNSGNCERETDSQICGRRRRGAVGFGGRLRLPSRGRVREQRPLCRTELSSASCDGLSGRGARERTCVCVTEALHRAVETRDVVRQLHFNEK